MSCLEETFSTRKGLQMPTDIQHPVAEKFDINCKNCAHPLDVEKPKCECCGSINLLYKSAQPKTKDIYSVNAENHLGLELSINSLGFQTGLPALPLPPRYEIPEEAKKKLQILNDHRKELVQSMVQKPKRSATFGEKLRNSKTMEFLANLIFGIF